MAFNVENAIRSFGRKIRPDPLTGKIDMNSITQYIMNNLDDPDVMRTLQHANQELSIRDTQKNNLRNIDFSSLPMEKCTIWFIKLHYVGMRDAEGIPISSKQASSQRGVRQIFNLHSWIEVGPAMGNEVYRMMEEFTGIPTSKQVEDFIRGSMAMPYPVFKPCIPNGIFLSSNLSQHEAALRPFLDSLPSPFWWKLRPVEFEAAVNEIGYEEEQYKFQQYMTLSKKKKDEGNKAYGEKNSQAAVKCYEEAIDVLDKALGRMNEGDVEISREARGLQAICFANCSIARLLSGREEDFKKAVEDAELAIELDASYPKGYVRLSRAYEALGKLADAEEAIVQALRLPELENNKALVDHLISIQTGGKGLPTDVDGFERWSKETFSEGQERAKRMQGVGGLWLKICNDHVDKMRSTTKD